MRGRLQTGAALDLKWGGGSVLWLLKPVCSPPLGKAAEPAGAPGTNDCLRMHQLCTACGHNSELCGCWASQCSAEGWPPAGRASHLPWEVGCAQGEIPIPRPGRRRLPFPSKTGLETQTQGQERSTVIWFCFPRCASPEGPCLVTSLPGMEAALWLLPLLRYQVTISNPFDR